MARFSCGRQRGIAWAVWAALALLTLAGPVQSQAPSGSVSGKSFGKGLAMQVDTRWVAGSGYRPVRVELSPITPLVDTRTVDLRFRVYSWYGRQRELQVAQTVDIPPGAAKVNVTLSVPEYSMWSAYGMEVWEDGRPIEKLSQQMMGMNNRGNVDVMEGLPSILVLRKAQQQPIDTSHLVEALKADGMMEQLQSAIGDSQSTPQLSTVLRCDVDELPGRWIDYSNLDVVCLSLAELDQLVTQQPGRWKALREWIAAGGNLWVYDAGDDWHGLPRIESALSVAVEPASDVADPLLRGWSAPDALSFARELDSGFSANADNWQANAEPESDASKQTAKPKTPQVAPENDFVSRPYQLGMVTAFSTADLLGVDRPDDSDLWRWRLNTMGPDRLLWVRRHGLSTRRANSEFWNFLVPGVGLVPVTAFRVLITIFMIAIGPLNYYWLRRKGRLHLLVVIVPLAALAITGALFGYAVVADGFDVRARARSFTHVDQRSGHAVCWSRLSYYAGLAPGGGLVFPQDVAVLPLDAADAGSDRAGTDRRVRWYEDSQVLASGWLGSRTSTQLLTVRSHKSDRGIDFLAGDSPRIKNRLGAAIKMILLAGPDGTLLVASSVADGATVSLQPADLEHDPAKLRALLSEQELAVPLGFDPQRYGMFGMRNFNYSSYNQWNNGLPDASMHASLLEHGVQECFESMYAQPAQLRPSTYLAVVDRSPEVVFGVEPVKEEASLHVITGEW